MTTLVWLAGARYFLRHPWLLALSVLGVAIGVAVVVAVDLANGSALRSFDLSVKAVTGRATHRILGGPSGLPDDLFRTLRLRGVRPSAPVVEGNVLLQGESYRMLGLDAFSEAPFRPYLEGSDRLAPLLATPGGIVVSASTGLRVGDRPMLGVGTGSVQVQVIGRLDPADELSRSALQGLVLADVATAQEVLGRPGRLDRIELILEPADVERVRALLPPGSELQEVGAASRSLREMARAFQMNLQALALLALIVGMFLIYNSVAFSVVQRRELLGTLRALGVTRREILVTLLTEALALGVAGTILGLLLGIVLSATLLTLVTRTMNDLYFAMEVQRLDLAADLLLRDAALALAATLLAALGPALEAASAPPRGAMRRSELEGRVRTAVPLGALAGVAAFLLGLALLAVPSRSLVLTLGASLGLVMGSSLLVPWLGARMLDGARPLLRRLLGVEGGMAAGGVTASLSRTAVALTALTLAVAVTVGMGVMVDSFRTTFVRWLDFYLACDVYVSSPALESSRGTRSMDLGVVERLSSASGASAVYRYRRATVGTDGAPANVAALQFDGRNDGSLRFAEGDAQDALRGFHEGEVVVSEPFAFKRDLRVGDALRLRTDRGLQPFRVAGVYYDYGSDQGLVMMDLATYRRHWSDPGVTSMAFLTAPGVSAADLAKELRRRAGPGQDLLIRSNREIRDLSLGVFERTFTVTGVLRMLAVGVAFVGILTALMALQLEQAREVALLRALGMTPGEVWRLVTIQTGLMGLVAGVLALPQGVLLGWIALAFLQRRSFGWTLEFHLDPGILVQAVALAVGAALLAGVIPSWAMSRVPPASALRDE